MDKEKVLETFVEKQAELAENLSFCSGTKVLHIRNCVKRMLDLIGKGGIFEEYTLHDISHIDEMFSIIEWLIPKKTKEKMTSAEWLMLTLAVYFHDLGMVVTKTEFNNRNETLFKEFKKSVLEGAVLEYKEYALSDEKFLYQEFVRENHAKRIRNWIENKAEINYGDATQICIEIEKLLSNMSTKFKKDLAMICESHHENDINDFEKYKVDARYGNDDNEKVNLNYIAIILRIADLFHITKDRTPSISRRLINISNPTSVIEWEKQMAVQAIKPQLKRNNEGEKDESLEMDTIEITAYFDGADTAEAYFGLSAYLKYAQKELSKCNSIINECKRIEKTTDYNFPWKVIDESNITANGFETKKLQFSIEQDNILQLLVGHTLYNDSSVVVRELVQNGIDAVRLQREYDKLEQKETVDGKVIVSWKSDTRELSFYDNGTGMTISDVENFLLKVGASKYRDETLIKQFPNFSSISHFGIGILTCFMIADDIDITTNSREQEDANIISLRNVNGSYLLKKIEKCKLSDEIAEHGTIVKLHVRNDVDMSSVESDLKKWIVVPDVPVFFVKDSGESTQISYKTLSDVLYEYLKNTGINIDNKKYKVCEKTIGSVTVAFALKYMEYLSDWSLMTISDEQRNIEQKQLPIGTCVEGIRVEFSTPGYKNPYILAIANIKNSKYKTNVVRTAIELDANAHVLSDIYSVFQEYIKEQMEELKQKNFSNSWALSEAIYLMEPLLNNYRPSYRFEPMDRKLLIEKLAKLECLILENDGKRKIVSPLDIQKLDEINIFDCKMVNAVEYLLREVRSDVTLASIIDTVYSQGDFLENANNIICNFDPNTLHRYALKDKEVSNISIIREQRRIKLTYTAENNLWYKFNLKNGYYSHLFVPKEEFVINGLEDEVGVKTIGGIYLRSGTEIYKYLMKMIEKFLEKENTDKNNYLLEVFISCMFNERTLEAEYKVEDMNNDSIKHFFSEQMIRVNGESFAKIWNMVDVKEFSEIVLTKNHALYSINNWSRNAKEI